MDVQCERCKTEYEFDDALVSGRGTTVRCTSCGHQFKVRRPDAPGSGGDASDRWLVKTGSGQQFTFLTLRELQRAILAHQVARSDLLRRAGAPPRPLGSISELEPFFEGRTTSSRPPPRPSSAAFVPNMPPDPPGVPVAFPKRSSITWEEDATTQQATTQQGPPPPLAPQRSTAMYGEPAAPPVRRKIDTLRPPVEASAAPPAPLRTTAPLPQEVPGPARRPAPPPPANTYPPRPPQAPSPAYVAQVAPSVLPPPTRPVLREPESADYDLPDMRAASPSSLEEPYSMRRGRRVGGWVVALVLLLAVGVLGWALARPYLAARSASAAAQLDPRAEGFLAEGEKAMADGNLDQAQEALDKASALADADPRVRLDEARVAAAQADVPWLKLKLLPPAAADDIRTTNAELGERVARAGRLADAALASAPDSAAAYRSKIDALRVAGHQEAARAFVTKVIADASQPETAYALAALDLAEPEPLWTTVIDRLRLAAAGEGNAGRARAALVYALAKSGDGAGARAELSRLDALARPYPLSPVLHAFLDRAPAKGAVDGGVDTTPPRPAPSGWTAAATAPGPAAASPPVATPPAGAAPPAAAGQAGGGDAVPGDSRSAMQLATQAYKKGDFARAREIYEAIVTRNPSDSEAVAALGDVARAEGDMKGAIAAYKRAISVNPSYLPALLGLADTEWASGDRAGAAKGYGDIVDRFPEGTYPAYVKQRVESAAPPADDTPAPAPKAAPSSTADELGP